MQPSTALNIAWVLPAAQAIQASGDATASQALIAALAARGASVSTCPAQATALPAAGDAASIGRLALADARRQASDWAVNWRQRQPDVVHLDLEGLMARTACDEARRLGIPVSAKAHLTHRQAPRRPDRVLELNLALHADCQAVVCLAPESADLLRAGGVRRTAVIPLGVDAQHFAPERRDAALRRAWGADDGDTVLIWVSRCILPKDPGLFVAAARAAVAQHPRTRVVIVGDGPARPAMLAALPGAVAAGVLHGDDLARAYASADLLFFPSALDTWGLVVGEAMASGLAVLAFDRAAAGSLISDGVSGILRPCDDRDGLVEAAVALAGDPARRQALGRAARAAVLPFSWEAVADQHLALWRSLLP